MLLLTGVLFLQKLSTIYNKLFHAYDKIVEVTESGKRCLGTYFRVSFYGSVSCIVIFLCFMAFLFKS